MLAHMHGANCLFVVWCLFLFNTEGERIVETCACCILLYIICIHNMYMYKRMSSVSRAVCVVSE